MRFTKENDNPNPFKQLYELVNNATAETSEWWALINKLFKSRKIDSERVLKAATPEDLDKFNRAVTNYLYATLRHAEDIDNYEKKIVEEFNALLANYASMKKINIDDLMEWWYAPRTIAADNAKVKHLTREERQAAKTEEAQKYMQSLKKVNWRYELSKKSFMPQMLNYVDDMVDSWIVSLKKWTTKQEFVADVIANIDKWTFNNFAKSYYELINQLDLANEQEQIKLYRKFSDYWCNKFAKKLWKNEKVLSVANSTAKSNIEDRFYKKSFVDLFNNKNAKDFYTIDTKQLDTEWIKELEEVEEAASDFKYSLEDFIDDWMDDARLEMDYLDDAGNEIDFWFRNADNDLVQENVQSMYKLNWEVFSKEMIQWVLNRHYMDKLLEPYKLIYNSNLLVEEWLNSETAKNLWINLWVYYNRVRWVEWVGKNIDKMF